ncbi:alpha/beta fold hydrolase [Streptomyces sp. NPDC018031]|uniref:alpha/beta fold hydrolase n=1 Tax=Streptomyces sp. NPDC018031 TaxID=3365033 RepID=UPI0037AABE4E
MSAYADDPHRTGVSVLPDGRRLGWAEWGPPDGTPVLLCPGAGTSRRLNFGADVPRDPLRVRLVSVDRPGLGASDPSPGRTLDDWATDVRHLAADRDLPAERLRIVGFSQGTPFALCCAARGLASAVAVVSAGDELAAPGFADALPPEVRELVRLATTDPRRAEESFAAFGSADTLWEVILAGSGETDRAVYREARFEPLFRQALAEGFRQGPAGYARDTLLSMSRWTFDPARITVPVDIWYGALDTSTVHSPDQGATLARRIPTARHHVLPEAGGALLWTHAERILRHLLRSGGPAH